MADINYYLIASRFESFTETQKLEAVTSIEKHLHRKGVLVPQNEFGKLSERLDFLLELLVGAESTVGLNSDFGVSTIHRVDGAFGDSEAGELPSVALRYSPSAKAPPDEKPINGHKPDFIALSEIECSDKVRNMLVYYIYSLIREGAVIETDGRRQLYAPESFIVSQGLSGNVEIYFDPVLNKYLNGLIPDFEREISRAEVSSFISLEQLIKIFVRCDYNPENVGKVKAYLSKLLEDKELILVGFDDKKVKAKYLVRDTAEGIVCRPEIAQFIYRDLQIGVGYNLTNSKYDWVRGFSLCQILKIEPTPENYKAIDEILKRRYDPASNPSLIAYGHKRSESRGWFYVREDALTSNPELITGKEVIELARTTCFDSLPEKIVFEDAIRYLTKRGVDYVPTLAEINDFEAIAKYINNGSNETANLIDLSTRVVQKSLIPRLDRVFQVKIDEEKKHWLSPTDVCERLSIHTAYSSAVSHILRELWARFEQEISVNGLQKPISSFLVRAIKEARITYFIDPEVIPYLITKEQVKEVHREIRPDLYKDRPIELDLNDKRWVKGLRLTNYFKLDAKKISAANVLLNEYGRLHPESQIVRYGHKTGEEGCEYYIDMEVIGSHPEIITREKIIFKYQDIIAETREYRSYQNIIKTLKGDAPGVTADLDEVAELKRFLKRKNDEDINLKDGKIMKLHELCDSGREKIDTGAVPYLRENYLTIPTPEKKHFVTGRAACEVLGCGTRQINALNSLLYDLWVEGNHNGSVVRMSGGPKVGVYIDPELLPQVITKEQVRQRFREGLSGPGNGGKS